MSYNSETNLYEGYIYKIINDVNEKLYIGQTISTLQKRFGQHTSNHKNVSNMAIYNAIQKYGKDHFSIVEIEKICEKDRIILKQKLNELEKKYIILFNTIAPNGYNLTSGGNDVSNRMRVKVDAYNSDGSFIKTFNSITEAAEYFGINNIGAITDCCKGIVNTTLCRKYTFRFHGDDFDKYNPFHYKRSKTVYQFDLSGKLLNVYPNVTIAGIQCFNNKIAGTRISNVLDKTTCLSGGYYWSSSGKFEFDAECYRKRKQVDQYTLDGEFICTYKSLSDACLKLNKSMENVSQITKCCTGKASHAFGYIWRYHGDDFNKYNLKIRRYKVAVDQYSTDGKFIATHETIISALRSIGIMSDAASSIKKCCEGKAINIYGYVWRYHGDAFNKFNTIPKPATNMKAVDQYDYNGKYIQTFDCAKYAGIALGHSNGSAITEVCLGKQYSAYGFIWRYHGVPFDSIDKAQPNKTKTINKGR